MITNRAEKVTIIESGKIWLPSSKSNYDSSIGSSVTFIAAFQVFYVSVQLCWFMCAHVFTLISHVYFYQDEKQIHLCFIKVCLSLLGFRFRVRRRFGSEIEPWRWNIFNAKQKMQEWISYAKDTFFVILPSSAAQWIFFNRWPWCDWSADFQPYFKRVFLHKFALILVSSVQSQICAGSYRCFLSKIQCGLPVTACKHCLFAFIKASLNCFFTLITASLISLGLTFKVKRYDIQTQHSESSSSTSVSFDVK